MEDFVTYEIAQKLKEKGFNEPCYGYYHLNGGDDSFEVCGNDSFDFLNSLNRFRIAAPFISQVLKWLREEKSLHIEVVSAAYGYIYIISDTPNKGGTDRVYSKYRGSNHGCAWDDYNECVFDAIEYVLDNLI